MKKEIVARATLKIPGIFFNTGFVHIKDDILEGIFTLDYLQMCIYNNKPTAHLSEKSYFLNDYGLAIIKITETLFRSKSNCANLYDPNIFYLYDESGEELILSVYEPVESYQIPSILHEIDKVRF